jgi:hypothetical protein
VGFHGDDDDEHDDGELCPRCQFIKRLAEYLNAVAGEIVVRLDERLKN